MLASTLAIIFVSLLTLFFALCLGHAVQPCLASLREKQNKGTFVHLQTIPDLARPELSVEFESSSSVEESI